MSKLLADINYIVKVMQIPLSAPVTTIAVDKRELAYVNGQYMILSTDFLQTAKEVLKAVREHLQVGLHQVFRLEQGIAHLDTLR